MRRHFELRLILAAGCLLAASWAHGDEPTAVDPAQVRALIEQNRELSRQVREQQKTIDDLRARVDAIGASNDRQERQLQDLRTQLGEAAPGDAASGRGGSGLGGGEVAIRLSGEAGFAFFDTGSDGPFANGEFRVDEAKLFVDAAVWGNVYLHTEAEFVIRESTDQNLHFGELYAEIENPLGSHAADGLVNLRVGRMYTPFGEEYQVRNLMDNPLISHSVPDIWGVDQGVETYGQSGRFSYAAAVQDGGIGSLHNGHPDKAVAVRAGFDPLPWLHLSASAMRTGRLSVAGDGLSALWFSNTFFRSLGPASTTSRFWADLGELDMAVHWRGGWVKGAGGLARYRDNNANPAARDARDLSYGYVEAVQRIADRLQAAVRFSRVAAPKGYPLVGQGIASEYQSVGEPTDDLSRLSMGLRYQMGPPVIFKVEFSPEWGRTTGGERRDRENLFSTEMGVRF
jgi:hypothetical protein